MVKPNCIRASNSASLSMAVFLTSSPARLNRHKTACADGCLTYTVKLEPQPGSVQIQRMNKKADQFGWIAGRKWAFHRENICAASLAKTMKLQKKQHRKGGCVP
jgi:hypothetical protein